MMVSPATAAAASAVDCSQSAASDERAARQIAATCGRRVEALNRRSETTQVFVDPNGIGTFISAVVPQRVHRGDGSWADVDTNLRADGDGFAPVASTVDVHFSGGGSGPLVTWTEGASTFTLAWPAPLPAPRIDGDTAIYEDVLPGVNLHVTAGVEGFRHVLEVTTPQAAHNQGLTHIRYALGGDMRVTRASDGALRLTDATGAVVGNAAPATMWDSTSKTSAPRTKQSQELGLRSGAKSSGNDARIAAVGVGLTGHDLELTPDAQMLAAPADAFPLYIDPAFNKVNTKWVYATSNGENNDSTYARVGLNEATGARYRSYFNFDTTAIHNTTLLTANFTIKLAHSWSCGPTPIWIYQVGSTTVGNTGRIPWSGTGSQPLPAGTALDSWSGNAHEGGTCPQPDVDAIFDSAGVFNALTSAVTQWYSYNVGLCTCDSNGSGESTQDRWKKFYIDKAYIVATYDTKPNAPTAAAFSNTTDCYAACTSPASVRDTTPILKVNLSDTYGGNLNTRFEVRAAADPASTLITSTASPVVSSTTGGPPATGTASWQVPVTLTPGTTYYWRAYSTDEANLVGDWSAWQTIIIDTSLPTVSSVTSGQYPYKAWGAAVGTAGTFTINATLYYDFDWWVDGGSSTKITSTSLSYTPPTDMVHVLHIRARDIAGNTITYDHEFWVTPSANRYSHWTFNETSGTTAADTGTGGSALSPGTLGGAATFTTGYPGLGGNGVHFGAVNDRVTTSGPVLDTTKSFTVMAWVHPTSLAAQTQQTVLAQDGTAASRFELQYRQSANGGLGGWCFTMSGTSAGGSQVSACADGSAVGVPADNAWVHLAGVYDATTGKIAVYVMGGNLSCGGEYAEATAPAAWQAGSSFAIGRGWLNSAGVSYFRGDVDDAWAYQRVLADSEICQAALA